MTFYPKNLKPTRKLSMVLAGSKSANESDANEWDRAIANRFG